jgi:hypothetical protein
MDASSCRQFTNLSFACNIKTNNNVCDQIAENKFAVVVTSAVAKFFPDDPP